MNTAAIMDNSEGDIRRETTPHVVCVSDRSASIGFYPKSNESQLHDGVLPATKRLQRRTTSLATLDGAGVPQNTRYKLCSTSLCISTAAKFSYEEKLCTFLRKA